MVAAVDLIVIPTFNEAENIEHVLDALLAAVRPEAVHVLIVDDSSPDGTADLVRAHPGFGSRVHMLSRPEKDGLGGAYRQGFGWAMERGYQRVVQMDADGSHDPRAVSTLLGAPAAADIAIGSRYVPGGGSPGWPWRRRLVSRGGNFYVRALLRLPVRDATSGFRAYRSAQVAAQVTAGGVSSGYSFQIESTWRAARAGMHLHEVPITFVDRQLGQSKMGIRIVLEALWRVLRWRLTPLGSATAPR